MGNEHHIKPLKGANLPPVPGEAKKSGEWLSQPRLEQPKHESPKQNAALLFDKKWQKSQAADLKNNLTTLISGDKKDLPAKRGNDAPPIVFDNNNNSLPKSQNSSIKKALDGTEKILTAETKNIFSGESKNNLSKTIFGDEKKSLNERAFFTQRQPEQAKSLHNQTLESLINLAGNHKDLERFGDKPKEFWNDVRQLSEVQIVEKYVNGKPEPRAVSRYGELVEQLARSGGQMEKFLSSLPAGERTVFEARHQIGKTFGATDLFVGRGVEIDRRGDFPVRVFLSANGKNTELSPHSILSLLGGKISGHSANPLFARALDGKNAGAPVDSYFSLSHFEFGGAEPALFENAAIFTNGQFLLNPKTAALLSLSLALYQNINASLPLSDVAPEFLSPNQAAAFVPKDSVPKPNQSVIKTANQNSAENGKSIDGAAARRTNEANAAAAALINGALATIDRYRKSKSEMSGTPAAAGAEKARFGFSAGATGAMMGATAGCIVPLAEKSAGEILGFAAGIVIGLTDGGLLALGANTLVSVITDGAQIFLSAASGNQKNLPDAASKFLNPANQIDDFKEEMRRTLLNRRVNTFLTR